MQFFLFGYSSISYHQLTFETCHPSHLPSLSPLLCFLFFVFVFSSRTLWSVTLSESLQGSVTLRRGITLWRSIIRSEVLRSITLTLRRVVFCDFKCQLINCAVLCYACRELFCFVLFFCFFSGIIMPEFTVLFYVFLFVCLFFFLINIFNFIFYLQPGQNQ